MNSPMVEGPRSLSWMQRPRLLIAALVVAALIVRLGVVAATPAFTPATDAADYDRHGLSIAAGHGYPPTQIAGAGGPSAFRPPAFPHAVAAIYAFTGAQGERGRWTAARLAEAGLGAVLVGLIGMLALALWGAAPAVVAAAIGAVYPPFLLMGSSLTSETLFLPLVVAGVLAMVRYRESRRLRWALAAGALAGLAALTRSNGVALLLPLLVGAWTVRPGSARTLAGGVATLAVALLVISPWSVRNAVALDAFVPVSTQAGYGLAGQYSDSSRDDPIHPSAWRPPYAHAPYRAIIEDPELNEAQVDRRLRSESRDFIRAHPEYVAQTGFRNTLRLLGLRDLAFEELAARYYGMSPALTKASIYSFYALALLALAGLSHPSVRRTPVFVWLTPVVMILTTVFIAAGIRYRVPADPFIICLAAAGLVQAFSWMSRRRGRTHPQTPMRSG
jgi:4-amino-4-deoxy-L-arabinose transferase-like glycosyltransferase